MLGYELDFNSCAIRDNFANPVTYGSYLVFVDG